MNATKSLDRGFNHMNAVNPIGNNVVTFYLIGVHYALSSEQRAKRKGERAVIVDPWKASKR